MRKISYRWLRYPKTRQELRANQDKNDPYIRSRRGSKYLPTAWDDNWIKKELSWKSLRKTQYRESKDNYKWHEFKYSWRNSPNDYDTYKEILNFVDRIRCYHINTGCGIKWFGPSYFKEE